MSWRLPDASLAMDAANPGRTLEHTRLTVNGVVFYRL